jgi:hypothetical protein
MFDIRTNTFLLIEILQNKFYYIIWKIKR